MAATKTMQELPDDSFPVHLDQHLRAQGLEGAKARAWVDGRGIHIGGDRGGRVSIPAEEVERLRLGMTGHHASVQVRLWRKGADEPMLIRPWSSQPSYAPMMRRIVAAVVAERGMAAIELGTSPRVAAGQLAVFLPSLAVLSATGFAAYRDGLWPVTIVSIVVSLLLLALVVPAGRNMIPRPLRVMEDLEQVFPKFPRRRRKQRIGP